MSQKTVLRGTLASAMTARQVVGFGCGIFHIDDCPLQAYWVAVMPGEKIVDLGPSPSADLHVSGHISDFRRYHIAISASATL